MHIFFVANGVYVPDLWGTRLVALDPSVYRASVVETSLSVLALFMGAMIGTLAILALCDDGRQDDGAPSRTNSRPFASHCASL